MTLDLLSSKHRLAGLALLTLTVALSGCGNVSLPPPATLPSEGHDPKTFPGPSPDGSSDQPPSQAEQPPGKAASNSAALVLLAQSETLRSQGQLPQAIAVVERAIRLEPSRADLWVQLGQLRLDEGEHARAEQYARKGIALSSAKDDPVRRRGWLLLADVSEARGDIEGANQIRSRWLNARG